MTQNDGLGVRRALLAAIAVCSLAGSPGWAGDAPRFRMPVDCELGQTCFLQHFVDTDGSSNVRDAQCGPSSYDGHKGTDIRVLSAAAAAAGIPVLAAADGTVLRVRDGVEDVFVTEETRDAVMDIGCGNAVVIDHGGGTSAMYCHLHKGSVSVSQGDKVQSGQRIGNVGYSGLASFPHLHFQVQQGGHEIDPFTGQPQGEACVTGGNFGSSMWESGLAEKLAATSSVIIQTGFTSQRPNRNALELDHRMEAPERSRGVLYFLARIINIRSGDRVRITLDGPGGFRHVSFSEPLTIYRPRHLEWGIAQTAKGTPLPAGTYHGHAELVRDGKTVSEQQGEVVLK